MTKAVPNVSMIFPATAGEVGRVEEKELSSLNHSKLSKRMIIMVSNLAY